MAITIYINGKKETFKDNAISISEILEMKKIRPEVVTVELNNIIIERKKYGATIIREGDRLEFVYYMGGGRKMQNPKCKMPASSADRQNAKLADNVLELIGNTPMVRLNKMTGKDMAEIYGKLESFNPGGSVKDRICLSMIEDAEERGLLQPGATIVEPTSGNTGIGLAMIAAVKGYKLILTMPETMSMERRYILESYGAKIILTRGIEGMKGAVKKAEKLIGKNPDYFMPQQFKNPANPQIHRRTTAREILEATDSRLDAFVAGVGTGGTITGVGEILKETIKKVKVIAVEPKASAVISGREPGPHKIQGIGAGFIPEVLNREVIDEIITVSDEDAFHTAKRLAKEEGLFVGISAGAATFAALKVAKELGKGKRVVVILPDTGERYFSIEQYFET